MTIEGIAARAGVGKQTIYRWWPSRAALVLEAYLSSAEVVATPKAGRTVRADVRALLGWLIAVLREPTGGRVVAGLVADIQHDADLAEGFHRDVVPARREAMLAALERGRARGEIREDADLELAVDALHGAVFYRLLLSGEALDEDFAARLADQVLEGLVRSRSSWVAVRTAIVLFTRDLRVHDHPALSTAAREAERVVPLFVLDDGIMQSDFARPNRIAFLRDALEDLDASLAKRGARLVLRSGDVVTEAVKVGDRGARRSDLRESRRQRVRARSPATARARVRREHRLDVRVCPGITIAEAGDVTTSSGTHFSVFTPFYRAWREVPRRPVEHAPRRLVLPSNVRRGRLPALEKLVYWQAVTRAAGGR